MNKNYSIEITASAGIEVTMRIMQVCTKRCVSIKYMTTEQKNESEYLTRLVVHTSIGTVALIKKQFEKLIDVSCCNLNEVSN